MATRKGKTLYLHVFNWSADGKLKVLLNNEVKIAALLVPGKRESRRTSWPTLSPSLSTVNRRPIISWCCETNRVQDIRELIRRDRTHPSACMWEACLNETGMSTNFIQRLSAATHEEYPGDQMFTTGWVKRFDIKLTSRQASSTKAFTSVSFPVLISEYGDWEYMAKLRSS